MACVKPNGELTTAALEVLARLAAPATDQEVAAAVARPVHQARAILRELIKIDLALRDGDQYRITPAGRTRLGG
jgi:DNA-binding IclR family transcriptional regulator